jgi:iron complex transport system permease protein
MKVTLDLAKLVEQGRLTQAEADRLKGFAAEGTGSLALNILIGFGVVAVALGVMGLVPQPVVAVALGGMMAGVGLGFILKGEENWAILANICLLAGSLMLAAGVMFMTKGSVLALMTVTAVFVAGGIVARSGLLIALAVLALSAAIGARTGYMRATYFLGIEQPLLTIVLFSGLALGTYHASKLLKADHARLAITAARTSLLLVNFGFWIGSLWGDRLTWLVDRGSTSRYAPVIPAWTFSILWAIAIVGVGLWAARANRPWVLNLAAVFGAIHFYTQWFEKLGPNPFSVLVAGVLTLGLAVTIWKYNQSRTIAA